MPSTKVLRITYLSVVAAIGGFLFGFDSGVINGTVEALQFTFKSDAATTGFNVASVLLGCAVGAFFAGKLSDRFGRKPLMILASIIFIISAWGSGMASNPTSFVLYRILGGIAVGGASILAPMYISEIAPSKIRGRLATMQQLMIVLGLFVAFLSNYYIARLAGGAKELFWMGSEAWRWMFWVEIVPSSIFLLSLLFIPESPRYLVKKGDSLKAEMILNNVFGLINANKKVKQIQQTIKTHRNSQLSDLFQENTKRLKPLVYVGIGLAAFQQLTGINVIFYYGATLWQAAGFSEADALTTNLISGTANILFTFVAIALIDEIGRKPLLQIGSIGQAVSLLAMAVLFSSAELNESGTLQLMGNNGVYALIAANSFIAFFAISWGPVMWVMLGEMFPNQYRGAALAICGIAQWGANFMITMTFPVFLKSLGLGVSYGVYAVFSMVAFVFVNRFVNETKGKSLEQMEM